MDDLTFNRLRALIYKQSGIHLKDGKKALVESRIGARLRALGLTEPKDYCKFVSGEGGEEEIVYLLDAISTNVTYFFREEEHFSFLKSVADRMLSAPKANRLRIWCAASSTGEEPYSIAMTLAEVIRGRSIDCKILATDISTRVLREAKRGVYPLARVEKVPSAFLSRYFVKQPGDGALPVFQIKDELRQMITYSRLNLSETPFPMKGPFDFVFCRNVMIYFDTAVRERLVNEMIRLLKPGGFLIVSHSETLAQLGAGLKSIKPSVYRKALIDEKGGD